MSVLPPPRANNSFSIGSGLTDAQRRAPPPAGSIVTFRCARCVAHAGASEDASALRVRQLTDAGCLSSCRYTELTPQGKPRFPRFSRVRADMRWEDVQAPPPRRNAR